MEGEERRRRFKMGLITLGVGGSYLALTVGMWEIAIFQPHLQEAGVPSNLLLYGCLAYGLLGLPLLVSSYTLAQRWWILGLFGLIPLVNWFAIGGLTAVTISAQRRPRPGHRALVSQFVAWASISVWVYLLIWQRLATNVRMDRWPTTTPGGRKLHPSPEEILSYCPVYDRLLLTPAVNLYYEDYGSAWLMLYSLALGGFAMVAFPWLARRVFAAFRGAGRASA